MLQIYAGRSGSGKTERIYQELVKRADQGNVVLLVPEQSSFQSEKRILNLLGAEKAANIRVLSFKRLYTAVIEQYGGFGTKRIDEGVKAVIMSLAAESVSDQLVLYNSRSKRSDFAQLMLGAINEYKMCAITPDQLMEAAQKTDHPRLRRKLTESAAVYSAYHALLGSAYSDPDDDMTRLYEMLWEHPFFEGMTVFVDSFNGFSGQERKIMEQILTQADYVGVALCCDHSTSGQLDSTIFNEPDTTLRQLKLLADKAGVEVLPTIWMEEQLRYKSKAIAAVEESVFRFDGDPYLIEDDTILLYEADDEYDEVRQAARDISRLVRKEGYEYQQITVVCRNPDMYRHLIAAEFPKFHIPYFMSDPKPLEDKPLVRLIFSAFDIIHSSFSTESILSFLKTGLTPLSDNDVFELENYVYLWDIRGKRWKQPFTMNPDGNTDKVDEKRLADIEELRRKVIEPLTAFEQAVSGARNGGEMTAAVYRLLISLNAPERTRQLIGHFDKVFDPKQKETEARVWDVIMDLLDKMYTILQHHSVSSRRYDELLRLMIAKHPISDIPQTLDQVIIGTAGNLRSEGQRAVLILGAIDGVFPAVPQATGLFSDSERIALIGLQLPLYDSLFGTMLKEKFHAYAALSLPSERLFVSRYLSNTKGETCEPSVIFRELEAILKGVRVRRHSDIKPEDYYYTEEQSFEECAAHWHDKDVLSASLKAHFASSEAFSGQYQAVGRAVTETPFKLKDKAHAKLVFGSSLKLSATQAETFFKCPFQYFCKYGLHAHPRKKTAVDASLYGSAVHYLLENMLRQVGYEKLSGLSEEELLELIRQYIGVYLKELGSSEERTDRFMAQFTIIERNLSIVLRRLLEEFKNSSFVPADFELKIGENGNIPAYELELPTGEKVSMEGIVDRVDTYEHNGKKYIRIVDYKTGERKFRLSDVLYGLNLQMLLYLSAIRKNGEKYYHAESCPLTPAGILYMPSTPTVKAGEQHTEEEKAEILKKQQAGFRMNGLLIDDQEILNAMEKDIKGLFIPVKLTKDKKIDAKLKSVVSLEAYGKIFSYLDNKLLKMAESLYNGDIVREPAKGAADACKYCDYRKVCGFEEGKPSHTVTNMGLEEALKTLEIELTPEQGKEEQKHE